MAEYADPFPNKVWKQVNIYGEEEPMPERRKYTSVSLEPEAIAQLHLAQAWLSGDRGKTATLSDTVAQLVDWYAVARAQQAKASSFDSNGHAPHTKENPHTDEDCDVCGFNDYMDRLTSR